MKNKHSHDATNKGNKNFITPLSFAKQPLGGAI